VAPAAQRDGPHHHHGRAKLPALVRVPRYQPSELQEKIVRTAGWYTVALLSVDVSNQVVDLNLRGTGTLATIDDSKYILTRIILKRLFFC
jgi:hypothetical protein